MIKNEVLEIISINNGICDDCITTDGKFKRRQQVNKRCNKLFDEGSIYREKKVCEKCRKFKIISLISKLGESRLETMHEKKIDERSTNFETEDFGIFDLKFEFKWIPIIEEKSVEYLFPTPLDKLSKKKHSLPSVYRWILISPNGKKLQDVYIGEASELSRRIYNYLNPGERQKTNKRLNTLFRVSCF
ncbi:MAG: hypothetical protein EOO43_26900 [Flavobacterium sp.]|nr:MAG: hypothetical protein EOO43_26900 [Flavobacterium sp.]